MKKIFAVFLFIVFCCCFIKAQSQTEKVETIPVTISASCSMFVVGWSYKVFQDRETFDKAILKGQLNCASEKIPDIDFKKYTLIGAGDNVGNCPSGKRFSVAVEKDDVKKLYLVKITIGFNPCRGLSYTARWVLVPKLPEGYEINFEKERTKETY